MQTNASGIPDFQNLFQYLPGLFIVTDPELTIITSNRAYLDKVNKKHEDIAGRNLTDLFLQDSEVVNAFVRKILKQRQPESLVIPKSPAVKITVIPVLEENKNEQFVLIKIDYLSEEMMAIDLEYRSVIEQATDAIFISDSKGKYIDVNPSACAMLGYSKNELVGMTTSDLLVAEEVAMNPPRFSELMNGKVILSRRNLRHRNGSIIPVEINARMLANGRMLGMVRDITERTQEEELTRSVNVQLEQKVKERTVELEMKIQLLRESEEKFQKAFQASAAGISITRLSDSTYADVNEAFLKMIGCSKEEVIGRSSAQLGFVVDMKKREEVLKEVREKGSVRHMEMTIRTKSGALFEILSSIETIVHNNEKYAINIIYDITERKQAEKKLEEVNKELEAFSYSVSHDLRAPLRSISGYSQVLLDDLGDTINEEGKSHLAIIRNNASRMSRLIDDLLEFSRIGKQELIKSTIDTESIVQKNVDDLTVSLIAKPEFKINALSGSIADFSMLNQVWFNLLSNAIKYSSRKEHPVIEIGCYSTEKETVFYVKDNGAGFNMDYVPKLFGVFQRLHRTTEFEGTGVGLALVKRIVEKHGGRTWAEGKINEGATFYFSLPV